MALGQKHIMQLLGSSSILIGWKPTRHIPTQEFRRFIVEQFVVTSLEVLPIPGPGVVLQEDVEGLEDTPLQGQTITASDLLTSRPNIRVGLTLPPCMSSQAPVWLAFGTGPEVCSSWRCFPWLKGQAPCFDTRA